MNQSIQWSGHEAQLQEIFNFIGDFSNLPDDGVHVGGPGIGFVPALGTLDIPTLDGTMTANPGDWIVKDLSGDIYVRRFPHKGRKIWKLIVTTCQQPAGASFIDDAWTNDKDGYRYTSKAIVWPFGNKNEYGERNRRRAVVIGWREKS